RVLYISLLKSSFCHCHLLSESHLKDLYKEHDLIPTDSNFKNLIRLFSWLKNKLYDSDEEIIHFINSNLESEFYGDGESVVKIYNL
uniref:hypothetical protein n=1 Tax=Mycoplasmopsis bovis TaxID=28903 RepID=UPI003D27BBA0